MLAFRRGLLAAVKAPCRKSRELAINLTPMSHAVDENFLRFPLHFVKIR